VTGAWNEIREHGELGPRFGRLLYATVEAVRRFNHYPPPAGAGPWSAEVVQDVAHAYLAEERTMGRVRRMAATANSEGSFENLLHADVKNWFLMAARATDTGATLEALRHALDQNERVVRLGESPTTRTWALREHADELQYSGDLRPLVEAAYAVEGVRAAKWRLDSPHRPPIAESDSLRRVLEAILEAAAAPLSPKQLLEVIRARFPVTARPTEVGAIDDDADLAASDPSSEDEIVADAIWADLTDAGKLVVGLADQPVRDVMAATGLSRGTAHRAMQAAAATVVGGLVGHGSPEGVMRVLSDWSAAVRSDGTDPRGSASRTGEEENRDE
jgi:hypothetical protein